MTNDKVVAAREAVSEARGGLERMLLRTSVGFLDARERREALFSAYEAALTRFGAVIFDALSAGTHRLVEVAQPTTGAPATRPNVVVDATGRPTAPTADGPTPHGDPTAPSDAVTASGGPLSTTPEEDAREAWPGPRVEITPEVLQRLREGMGPKLGGSTAARGNGRGSRVTARAPTRRGQAWTAGSVGLEPTMPAAATGGAAPGSESAKADDELRLLLEETRTGLGGDALVRRLAKLVRNGVAPTDPRLVRLAALVLPELQGVSALKRTRRAAQKLAEKEPGIEADLATREHIPPEWPHWGATRGKVAAIVGGEPRPERVERLQQLFGFQSVHWVDGAAAGGKQVDALVQRMRSGSVDVVIVLRAFSSHNLTDKIFGVQDGPCLKILADTYGVLQVRLGFERFLGSREV